MGAYHLFKNPEEAEYNLQAANTDTLIEKTGASLVVQWLRMHQCMGHGFEPWSGKIPHATEKLSPCATTTEPAL